MANQMGAWFTAGRSENVNVTEPDIIRHLTKAGLKPPKAVTMAVTNHCNLRCRHCWPSSGPGVPASMVPGGDVLRLMAGFSALGAEKLVITGGEPLTHPAWSDFLTDACENLGFGEVRLQTNAILLTLQHVKRLLPLVDHGLMVQTSLEGATAENHDRVRGPGSFDLTMRGLDLLVKSGMARRICITFTEMQHNFDDVPNLLAMVDNLGIGQFVSGTLVCDGRAARSADLAPPTPGQYEDLLAHYHDDGTFRDRYERIGNIAALEWGSGGDEITHPCCSFIETPYVTAEGQLFPCVMLHANDFAATGIYHRSLATAIAEKIEPWSRLQQIGIARRTQIESCKACPGYVTCGAGCMGRAYSAYGDFFAVEDRCQHRMAVYRRNITGQ